MRPASVTRRGKREGCHHSRTERLPRAQLSVNLLADWQTFGKLLATKLRRIRGASGHVASWQHPFMTKKKGILAILHLAVTGIAEVIAD